MLKEISLCLEGKIKTIALLTVSDLGALSCRLQRPLQRELDRAPSARHQGKRARQPSHKPLHPLLLLQLLQHRRLPLPKRPQRLWPRVGCHGHTFEAADVTVALGVARLQEFCDRRDLFRGRLCVTPWVIMRVR